MKGNKLLSVVLTLVVLLLLSLVPGAAQGPEIPQAPGPQGFLRARIPTGSAFTYQGYLVSDGEPVDDSCNFQFSLYDDLVTGTLVAGPLEQAGIAVVAGYFTALLDFGSVFDGTALWLEIAVQCSGDAGYTTLDPRQELTAAPYAAYSQAAPWEGIADMPAGFVDGVDDDILGGLSCGNGQIAKWDGSAWICGDDDAGGGPHDHWGESWSGSGTGLTLSGGDTGLSGSGADHGLYGSSDSTDGHGLYGYASASSGETYGVYGSSDSTDGRGVFGITTATSGTNYGVYGVSQSPDGYGVFGTSANGSGGFFTSDQDHLDIGLGGEVGRINAADSATSQLYLSANGDVIIKLDNDGGGDNVLRVKNSSGADVCTVNEAGDLSCTGGKNAVVETEDYGWRKLYAVEGPEVWFEDIGSAALVDGEAAVAFEAIFVQTINPTEDYQVFLTPLSDDPVLLFVTSKTAEGFTVEGVTLDGQPASCPFDYRVVAKRLGYEDIRLDSIDWQAEEVQP